MKEETLRISRDALELLENHLQTQLLEAAESFGEGRVAQVARNIRRVQTALVEVKLEYRKALALET